jgi:translation initiation factor IF-2
VTDEQLNKAVADDLSQKLADVTKELVSKPAYEPRPTQQVLDMDRILAAGNRLLSTKTAELSREISSYQLQRIEITDSYRVRIESLKTEAEEQLRVLDQEHQNKIDSLEKIINRLRLLRGD